MESFRAEIECPSIYFLPNFYTNINMEQTSQPKLPNKIEVSEIGYELFKGLPAEMSALASPVDENNEVPFGYSLMRKGKRLDFRSFASQTQTLLKHSSWALIKPNKGQLPAESQRKLQLHHEQWVSEQRLLSHKVADSQARLQQNKYSEYDCRGTSLYLRHQAGDILAEWEDNQEGRKQRTREKLRRLLGRKYPGRE
jgi:hypothetical protein